MNMGSSLPKVLRTRVISERHIIERTTGTCFILSAIGYVISHEVGIHLSTGCGVISFCHCISLRLIANQTTHSLKSLAPFYGNVWPSRRISGL